MFEVYALEFIKCIVYNVYIIAVINNIVFVLFMIMLNVFHLGSV